MGDVQASDDNQRVMACDEGRFGNSTMSSISRQRFLKRSLDRLYSDYDFKGRIRHDPIELVHRYRRAEDIEVAGIIAAALAYGKVSLFKPVAAGILENMGESPYEYLKGFRLQSARRHFAGIRYRLSTETDLLAFLYAISRALKKHGSLRALFLSGFSFHHSNIRPALTAAMDYLRSTDLSSVYGNNIKPRGFLHLLPSPASGGPAKRMALYLRWMVRHRDIDFGIWKEMGPERLVIPLDTHIERISQCIGLTRRRTRDWKMAEEITGELAKFSREDPLMYDFALCHQGISGLCRAGSGISCNRCGLAE